MTASKSDSRTATARLAPHLGASPEASSMPEHDIRILANLARIFLVPGYRVLGFDGSAYGALLDEKWEVNTIL